MERCYFDWAATAIPDRNISGSAHPLNSFANPSSIHKEGKRARSALEEARSRCALALGVRPEEIYFTSGGTESNAIVLFSLLIKSKITLRSFGKTQNNIQAAPDKSAVLLYSAAEHPSIRENTAVLSQLGIHSAPIGVETDGRISETKLERALAKNPNARMAAIMAVNNETGAINDLEALAAVLRKRCDSLLAPVHFHCDAVQAAGKIPLDFHWLGN